MHQAAVAAARAADLVVLVLGENDEDGEGKDKTDLRLSEASRSLLNAVSEVNTPTVLVLQNGRPLVLSEVTPKVDALLETWYAGEKSGQAIVNVLTGQVNPSGKLPISFPRSNGQLPIYYNHKKSNNGSYLDNSNQPLFAFGHGLSYSRFAYEGLKLEKPEIGKEGTQKVSVTITNTSDRAGDEIVQLYIQDVYSSVSTPVLQLKGFQRVSLSPEESKVVSFYLSPEDLSLWNAAMERVVEPGEFKVMVGAASNDIKLESAFYVK
ncbi:MAG: glycoside hydrolase family 3 C-terminal domain-containing protein [Bacteroidota bacterium]